MPIPLLALLLGGGGAGAGQVGASMASGATGAMPVGGGFGAAGMGTSMGTSAGTSTGAVGKMAALQQMMQRGVGGVDRFVGGLEGRLGMGTKTPLGESSGLPVAGLQGDAAMGWKMPNYAHDAAGEFAAPGAQETTAQNARLIADLMASLRRR